MEDQHWSWLGIVLADLLVLLGFYSLIHRVWIKPSKERESKAKDKHIETVMYRARTEETIKHLTGRLDRHEGKDDKIFNILDDIRDRVSRIEGCLRKANGM